MLRGGVTPRRMAWSIAIGMMVGINPTIGLTTVVVILLAAMFRLNQAASQVGTHIVAPIHVLLFLPFIQAGVYFFHTRRLPFTRAQLHHLGHNPIHLLRTIWQWEWHALIIWACVAVVLTPLLAIWLRRALVVLMRKNTALMHPQPVQR